VGSSCRVTIGSAPFRTCSSALGAATINVTAIDAVSVADGGLDLREARRGWLAESESVAFLAALLNRWTERFYRAIT
jgi:hypothetical protein